MWERSKSSRSLGQKTPYSKDEEKTEEHSEYVYKPTRCTEILVIRLYFLLDALHVSDYISPSSGATL